MNGTTESVSELRSKKLSLMNGGKRRELYPGFSVPALTLGGAPLGGIDEGEAQSILQVAADAGIELVDTSSAYGESEAVIGRAPVKMSVTTKFGNPCGLNNHTHDYSAAHCVTALYNSLEQLRGKPIACLQLHSPPEHPTPLTPALVDCLESMRTAGKFGAWGASVHSVNGGQVALAAGAKMLQVPYNLLQQETAALLAICAVQGVGVLVQSSLCQGWLTEQGVIAARLLLSQPHRLPESVSAHGSSVLLPPLLRRVLELDALASRFETTLSEMALCFALHAPGVSSVLVQVRTASQLSEIVASDLHPLPTACQQALIRLAAAETEGGALRHGAGQHLWHWGVPTPRSCIESVARRGFDGGPERLLTTALGGEGSDACEKHSLRRRFLIDGYVKLPGAFSPSLCEALVADVKTHPGIQGLYHAYETAHGYFRTDARAPITPEHREECRGLEAALEEILDVKLYGERDVHSSGLLEAATLSNSNWPVPFAARPNVETGVPTFTHSVAGHRQTEEPTRRPWGPPDGYRTHTMQHIGIENGWHIDDGHSTPDFTLDSYLKSPWLILVVLLTDVEDEGGPTVLCKGSHHTMARLLSVGPGCLKSYKIYSMLSCVALWARLFGPSSSSDGNENDDVTVRATGKVGDVYLVHPLLAHCPTISCTGNFRAILNLPIPYSQSHVAKKQGGLSGVNLPIYHAMACRPITPKPILWLLWQIGIACGYLHRKTRGVRGVSPLDQALSYVLYVPSVLMLALNLTCFLLLDLLTRFATHDESAPLIDDGRPRPRCDLSGLSPAYVSTVQWFSVTLPSKLISLIRRKGAEHELKPLVAPV